ncbi:MAG: hypothetical protein ABIK86_02410 [candidate division WOR-3 bacterium]
MNVEALVMMLEEHLSDIRQRLALDSWRSFVSLLDESARTLAPLRHDLEKWADRVSLFLAQYDYTKGLLQGLIFASTLKVRGVPVDLSGLGGDSAAQPAGELTEQGLVERIKVIARRARTIA